MVVNSLKKDTESGLRYTDILEKLCIMNNKIFFFIPFVCFIAGYYITARMLGNDVITVPAVIGKSLYEGVQLLSDSRLNARIITYKEDALLPEGTIVSQNPQALNRARAQQTVFLGVVKKPPLKKTPLFIGMIEPEANVLAEKTNIILKKIIIPSTAPRGACIGQIPTAGTTLVTDQCVLYVSAGAGTYRIMPYCIGIRAEEVVQFFKEFGVSVELFSDESDIVCAYVTDQRPLPGTCIDTSRPFTVQLSVTSTEQILE